MGLLLQAAGRVHLAVGEGQQLLILGIGLEGFLDVDAVLVVQGSQVLEGAVGAVLGNDQLVGGAEQNVAQLLVRGDHDFQLGGPLGRGQEVEYELSAHALLEVGSGVAGVDILQRGRLGAHDGDHLVGLGGGGGAQACESSERKNQSQEQRQLAGHRSYLL